MALDPVRALQERLAYEQKLVQVVDRIHAARSLDGIFLDLHDEILGLTAAERMMLYAVDPDRHELYSKLVVPGGTGEIREARVPISEKSIAGYVASVRRMVNIVDAYDAAELVRITRALTFDSSWDQRTGFRTRQVLAMPILHEGRIVGVIQLLNRKTGSRFTMDDETSVARIAKTLGVAFNTQLRLAQRRAGKFDYLLTQHLLTQDELGRAVAEARRTQRDVETILLERFKVPKAQLGGALAEFYGCPFVEFDPRLVPPADLVRGLELEYLKKALWVPLRREETGLTVLVDNPQDIQKVDTIVRLLPRQKIHFAVGLRTDILKFLAEVGGEPAPPDALGAVEAAGVPELSEDVAGDDVDENDGVVIGLANQIIVDACAARATDIHIEPYGARRDTVIRIRVDGGCVEYQKIPAAYRRAIVARIKVMAQLDLAERRRPQDGKIRFTLPEGKAIELRVATVPTVTADEDVVIRVLASNEPLPLDALGMAERTRREVRRIAEKRCGLILCAGPAGSGKTTTLHSVLGCLNKPERKIWTAENPVEITQDGVRQVEVNPALGLTFAMAIRSFLRADPDVIMVGEMRDAETAAAGIEASLTGHLVLGSLPTTTAVGTVTRLLGMGLDAFDFADALLGILAQRLVKRICERCREPYRADRAEYDALAHGYGEEEFEALGHRYQDGVTLYRGKGCGFCNNTGYRGRLGVHELLIATDEMKRLIQNRASVAEMLALARAEGMITLAQDGVLKSLSGLTDFAQVKAVTIR